jgi:hypothetical protein
LRAEGKDVIIKILLELDIDISDNHQGPGRSFLPCHNLGNNYNQGGNCVNRSELMPIG